MRVRDYDLIIMVDGEPIDELYEEANDATWITALMGKEFQVFINNNSDRRILAVPLIDGLSVMDGKPGTIHSNGYIFDAHKGGVIPGWRIDKETVAAFKFDSASRSMSFFAKKDARETGSVLCAIYPEKSYSKSRPKHTLKDSIEKIGVITSSLDAMYCHGGSYLRDIQAPAPKKSLPSAQGRGLASLFNDNSQEQNEKVAVGFGSSQKHRINEVHFTKESEIPICTMAIRYDTQRNISSRSGFLVTKVEYCQKWMALGGEAMVAQRHLEAIDAFSRIAKVRPDVDAIWEALAMAHELSGDKKGMISAISALARLDYKNAKRWELLGALYAGENEWEKALEAFDKYNELAPYISGSWNNLGFTLIKMGKLDEAWYCCEQALEIDPKSFYAWDSLGSVHLNAGRFDDAAQAFSKAVAINPEHAESWQNLWTTYKKMGRDDDASCAMGHLSQINPAVAQQISSQY